MMTEEKQPKQQKNFRAWSRVWSRSFGQSGAWADDLSSTNIHLIHSSSNWKSSSYFLLVYSTVPKKTNHCAIRSDHEWMRQTKETQPTVWGRRLRWNIPANRTEARWMEWILWNWIRACKSLGVEKRSIDQISNSNQGLFQCDAPGIWRQGRQSARSRVIRKGIAGISEVCSVKLPVSSRASLTNPASCEQ